MRSDHERQALYHAELFGRFAEWSQLAQQIADFTGELSVRGLIGLDQMGHFGPSGCDLIIERASSG
jgi:hypothetical protein